MTRLRMGIGEGALARLQSEAVAAQLMAAHGGLEVEVVAVGARVQEALQQGEVDVVVHRYEELPTTRREGLALAAVAGRGDPRDALVSRRGKRLRNLPAGVVVGTVNAGQAAQVTEVRADFEVRTVSGGVEAALEGLERGEFDAVVVGLAGLQRLGLEGKVTQVFGYEEMLPAAAQGVLAVECRAADDATRELLRAIDDGEVRTAVVAERSFLARLGTGGSFPGAAYAETFGTTLKLHGLLALDGRIVRSKMGGPAETAAGLGRALADELMTLAGITRAEG